jgi:hypothetical protein
MGIISSELHSKLAKKSVKMVERILEDPCLIELWDLGDHKKSSERSEKLSKW